MMVKGAVAGTPVDARVGYVQADARALPFADERFARARVDRVLQHIAGPEQVMREMVRVLAPGGLMLAYDIDWGTFADTAPTNCESD